MSVNLVFLLIIVINDYYRKLLYIKTSVKSEYSGCKAVFIPSLTITKCIFDPSLSKVLIRYLKKFLIKYSHGLYYFMCTSFLSFKIQSFDECKEKFMI